MGWDVSDFTATENAMKEIIRTCGRIWHVVVNNAGITRDGLLMKHEGRGLRRGCWM